MKKVKSTVVYRSHRLVSYAIGKYLACGDVGGVNPRMTVREFADVCGVTQVTVRKSVNLLIKWGVLRRVSDGVSTHYYLTDRGIEWYEKHEDFVESLSEIDKAVQYANMA